MNMNMSKSILVVVVCGLALLQCTMAQTTHVVGGALGWTVPPGGQIAYSTWAASQTFRVGDIITFNFTKGSHDVAKVTKTSFNGCNTNSTIGSIITTSPANITLDSPGEHFFICTFTQHCNFGQKLAINVTASSASPPSTTPSPVPASSPTAAIRHVVGDTMGWTVPPGGSVAYSTWASIQLFRVGDSLVFNFTDGAHNVAEVTKAAYDACNGSSTIGSIKTTSPATIALDSNGPHYYICTFPQHCSLGQKLAINVTGSATATPPSSPATPPSTSTPPSSPATPPSSSAPPPSSPATPPSSSAPPPSSPATPPSSSAPPPSGSATPPTTPSTTPPPPTGGPPSNAATSVVVASFPVIFSLFFGLAFFL